MLKAATLIFMGFAAGWLVHEFVDKHSTHDLVMVQPHSVSDLVVPEQPVPGSNPDSGAVETIPQEPAPVQETPDPQPTIANFLAGVTASINARDFGGALEQCLQAPRHLLEPCRQSIIGSVDSGELTHYESAQLLELWLLEFPDDIDAGVRLVEILINDEQYVPAARRLALLQSYQVEPGRLARVASEIQSVARAAIIKLTLTDDREGLESLLSILIEMEPHRAAWHYSLAKVQYEMENYSEALNSLSYILFDPDYGDRASTMYEDITEKLNLASYSPVPISVSGSHFLVRATIDGVHDVTLLLDTGASITSLDARLVRNLGLKSSGSRELLLRTAGGVITAKTIEVDSLNIGGHVVRGLEIATVDLGSGVADGLLGMNFLGEFKFVIDQKQRQLLLTRR